MFAVPEGYARALAGNVVQIDVYIAIGSNIDPTAADDITAIEGLFLPMSNVEQVTDANYQITHGLATFEADGIKTAADSKNMAPPISPRAYPPQVGLWSEGISDGQGKTDFSMTIRLGGPHTSALTVYTDGMNILEGTAVFYNGASEAGTAPLVPGSGRAMVKDPHTFDTIRLDISRIDKPYSHVKISEIEFGSSITYSKSKLTGEVTLIKEWDPLMLTIPLHELDFSILNVLGEFDPDNPSGLYDTIRQDYPVELSFSLTFEDGSKHTVPCGRFMISSKKAEDTALNVVALDARSALSNNHGGLAINRGQSFGDMFRLLFDGLNIPFAVDEGLFTEYPDQDMTFDGEKYDLLTIMRFMEQYYGIWLVPERTGSIRVTHSIPSGDYGTIDPAMVVRFPKSDIGRSFNFISVSYGPETKREAYVEDLRTDPAQLRAQVAINNPLVQTVEKAREIAAKVKAAVFSERVTTEWRGDPAMDVTDTLRVAGRWTPDAPIQYRVLYSELTYNGGLDEKTTAYR